MQTQHNCKCGNCCYSIRGESSGEKDDYLQFLSCDHCGQLWTKQKDSEGNIRWCPYTDFQKPIKELPIVHISFRQRLRVILSCVKNKLFG